MSETVVETHDLSMRFGGVLAVNNVNFSLRERELRCLIGPNGAGKSTFFKCLTGQIRRDAAERPRVHPRRRTSTGWRAYEIVRLGVGIKTQVPSVMNGLTVEENLWLSARRTCKREAGAGRGRRGRAADARLGGSRAGWSASSRTASASSSRSASCSPSRPWLLLLDEPAAGITGAETERLVRSSSESTRTRPSSSSITTCSSCACSARASRCSTRARSCIEGPVDEVLDRPEGARGLHREPRADERRCNATSRRDRGRSATAPARRRRPRCRRPARRLRPRSGAAWRLVRSCARARRVGIVGHNGMGKTTLLKALIGLLPATAGRISIDGVDVTR